MAVTYSAGEVLATDSFATTRQNYRKMYAWFASFGTLRSVGIEATGAYGAGIARHMARQALLCSRSPIRIALSGVAPARTTLSMRLLLPGRRSPSTRADRQGPQWPYGGSTRVAHHPQDDRALPPLCSSSTTPSSPLVAELAPGLLVLPGVGVQNAGELLVTAGQNPERLRSEAGFAMPCGACPIPASSGKTVRYRLNRDGDRQANSALHMIVVFRMRTDARTKADVALGCPIYWNQRWGSPPPDGQPRDAHLHRRQSHCLYRLAEP